jgi:1,4-dihydroxy-2-naphthoyl-CoA hydrolase
VAALSRPARQGSWCRRPHGHAAAFRHHHHSADKDKIVGEMQADERHLNAFGILHGGAVMAFGDELGGLGSRFHIPPGTRTATIESKTNFFRSCSQGRVTGESVPLHLGRRMLVWRTSIYDPDGKRVALVTQTQLVLPAAQGTPTE